MEKWAKIKQVQKDNYFVSDYGRIKVIKKSGEKIKLGYLGSDGYYVFSHTFKVKPLKVHQAVLESFTERPEWAQCINHKNGIRTDNRLTNLEWSTVKLNNEHALNKRTGERHHSSIPIEKVHKIYELKKLGMRQKDAMNLGLLRSRVRAIWTGRDWKYEYRKFFG